MGQDDIVAYEPNLVILATAGALSLSRYWTFVRQYRMTADREEMTHMMKTHCHGWNLG